MTNRDTAIQVHRLKDIIAVVAAPRFSIAIRKDGTIWSWGWNYYGQSGHAGRTDHVPVLVGGIFDAVQIDAGNTHGAALKADGTVWTGEQWRRPNRERIDLGLADTLPRGYP